MLSYNQVLQALSGKGRVRRPRPEFWYLYQSWGRMLRLAGVFKMKTDKGWRIDISQFSAERLDWAEIQIEAAAATAEQDVADPNGRQQLPLALIENPAAPLHPSARFSKGRHGAWYIIGNDPVPKPGTFITVRTKDGKLAIVRIEGLEDCRWPGYGPRSPYDPDWQATFTWAS